MGTTEDTEDMEPTIVLPAVVDLAAADALLATLRQRLAADHACDLDASNVESLMLPGIQVILAAIKSSKKVQVLNPSASFRSAFDDAALSWTRGDETGPDQVPVQEPAQAQAHKQIPVQDQMPGHQPQPDLEQAAAQSQLGQEVEAR